MIKKLWTIADSPKPKYAFNSVLKFFQSKREQIDRQQIAINSVVRNYLKSIKFFCDMRDLQIYLLAWIAGVKVLLINYA
jgi:hypothetical protein